MIEITIKIRLAASPSWASSGIKHNNIPTFSATAGTDISRMVRCVSSIELKPSKEANVILISYLGSSPW